MQASTQEHMYTKHDILGQFFGFTCKFLLLGLQWQWWNVHLCRITHGTTDPFLICVQHIMYNLLH